MRVLLPAITPSTRGESGDDALVGPAELFALGSRT
jgi:hypothetical protein